MPSSPRAVSDLDSASTCDFSTAISTPVLTFKPPEFEPPLPSLTPATSYSSTSKDITHVSGLSNLSLGDIEVVIPIEGDYGIPNVIPVEDTPTETSKHSLPGSPGLPALEDHEETTTNVRKQRKETINTITNRGIMVSALFMVISVCSMYSELYLNLTPSKTNGGVEYIEESDALFLCLGPAVVMFTSYFVQKQSLFQDVPAKHIALTLLHQISALARTVFHLWSLWSLGIVIKSIINVMSIVFLTIAEKVVFRKRLFIPDALGICLLVASLLWLIPLAGESKQLLTGLLFEMITCVLGTITNLLAEYICKIDYVPEMNRYFGSPEAARKHMVPGHETSMSSAFWLGINGVIALPLVITLILCSSFLFDGHSAMKILDFGSKLMGNEWLLVLYIGGTMLLYLKFYAATEVQVHVSSVAKKLLKSFVTIPIWIINLFIATNPREGGQPLDTFDYRLWTEWCLVASFLFSAMGVLFYYEIVGPSRWKRAVSDETDAAPNGTQTKSSERVCDGEHSVTSSTTTTTTTRNEGMV